MSVCALQVGAISVRGRLCGRHIRMYGRLCVGVMNLYEEL